MYPVLGNATYFLIASIFVPRYRSYIKEGWHCFIDKLRGKNCSVSFDNNETSLIGSGLQKKVCPELENFSTTKETYISILWFVKPPCAAETCGI